jgi:mycothiol synthase
MRTMQQGRRMSGEVTVHSALREGFVSRAVTMDELEEIVDLFNAYWEPMLGMSKFTIDDMRGHMTMPGFDIETSTRVVLSSQGRIVGCIAVIDLGIPPVHPIVSGCVRPGFEGQGIGTYLIGWAEGRARQAVVRVPDGLRVSMQLEASSAHGPTARLFEKQGLEVVRYSWLMVADLDGMPPEPEWPGGIVLHTYQDYPDLEAVCRTVNEAFQDHWGYVGSPIEDMTRQWQHRIESDEEFDPSLWFLAMDDDEIAGVSLCGPRVGDDTEMGLVDVLGVRRPWRRKGLGLALLHHAFGEFHCRGQKRVSLGVDAESLTGATRLYEKAGMRVVRQLARYEKELRPGREPGTQAVED